MESINNIDSICGKNIKKVSRLIYELLIILTISVFFILLELKVPYYFFQDDNRLYSFGNFVHNYRSILNFEIPLYNFYQFLGSTALACGQSAALYPITYISVFLSSILFGNYFACMDIYVYINLCIAGIGFFYFMRYFGFNKISSFFGAISWVMCSFVIYVSDSGVSISGLAAYFPILIHLSIKLYREANYKVLLQLAVVRCLLLLIGHPQFFVYCVLFEILTIGSLIFFENIDKIFKKQNKNQKR